LSSITDQIESKTFEAGLVVKVHGVNGKLVIRMNRPASDILDFPEWLFIRIDGGLVPYCVMEESVFQKDASHIVLALDGVTSQEKASALIGLACNLEGAWTDWFEGTRADEDSLTGFVIFDETSGKSGKVIGFEDIPGNPLLEIEIGGKKSLLPLNPEFVISTDRSQRRLILRIPEGLLDL
jgi:16S rRNA processing protein RimM